METENPDQENDNRSTQNGVESEKGQNERTGQSHFELGRMAASKNILIIAGPNGAGKTTFARNYLLNEADYSTFINADMIAEGLNPFDPERAAFAAGRVMLRMIDEYVCRGESFAFETTLSGRTYARTIPEWQAEGYWVTLCFLRLPTPEMAVSRVRDRVREGGHHVDEEVVRRRFDAGWRNFQQLYRDIVDEWVLYDASQETPRIAERGSSHGQAE